MITITKYVTNFKMYIRPDEYGSDAIRYYLKRKLADYTFNPRNKRWTLDNRYYRYNEQTSILSIPINYYDEVTKVLIDRNIPFEIDIFYPSNGRTIDIELNPEYHPKDIQVQGIEALMNPNRNRKGLQLATGLGKTFITINTICKLKQCAIILVAGLVEQWVNEFKKFTNIRNIYTIKGKASVSKLFKLDTIPDVVIASIQTIRNYVSYGDNYHDLPTYKVFLEYLGVGVKVIDEVHLNFSTSTQIELMTDSIKTNIYLTATFDSSKSGTKRIFDTIYEEELRFGRTRLNSYTTTYMYGYESEVPSRVVVKARGYSHLAFEKWLVDRPVAAYSFFSSIFKQLINEHYVNIKEPNEKCLIFFSTLNMIYLFQRWLKVNISELTSIAYVAGVDDSVLTEYDVILSTFNKAGTGRDIKNLRTCINTISLQSAPLTAQIHGRLRKLDSGPVFVDMYAVNIPSHRKHRIVRERIYKMRSKQYIHRMI